MAQPLQTVLALSVALTFGSCAPPPGKPLVDGCYYANGTPVLKVNGDKGTLLVPGKIHTVTVEADASSQQAGVTFTPGFHLHVGPPLTVSRVTDLPRSSMMMKPATDRPTIMAITDPPGLLDLVHGPDC